MAIFCFQLSSWHLRLALVDLVWTSQLHFQHPPSFTSLRLEL
ncbi:hypothetical protein M758_9G121700 [Ceratodon purpureus]|uniref:Uncharacterized protein n=1 Tax=Ceratodon purpureus TaxID=3225 RepID=A0A8T0GTR5_CERPU|nr:hypothetical protein KC19_9G106300 [Ceratodon purpureus]KAG0606199.1 hypothetical protein M758_9G121700 [Ceratodon purpureus]